MTAAPADTREVILATIRERLLDDDAHVLRLDPGDSDRHTASVAEHALEAALARGATLADVYATAVAEVSRVEVDGVELGPEPDASGLFEAELDRFADVLVESWAPAAPALLHGRTVAEIRRTSTTRMLYVLVAKLEVRAVERVSRIAAERIRAAGLPWATATGEVVDERERVAVYTAALYGETTPEAPTA